MKPTYDVPEGEHRRVIIMRGASGAGKSTIARYIMEQVDERSPNAEIAYCSADEYHYSPEGEYEFSMENLKHAHPWCLEGYLDAIESGADLIIVDNTHMKIQEMSTYYHIARCKRLHVTIITAHAFHPEILSHLNVHGVSESIIESQLDKFERTPSRWEAEKIDHLLGQNQHIEGLVSRIISSLMGALRS